MIKEGTVKANKYRQFSASNLAGRSGDLWAKSVKLDRVPAPKQAV